MSDKIRPMATCLQCGAPLIPTTAFRGHEFYCLECGVHVTFFGPRAAEPTPELDARYEALKAEWDEHAGSKLLVNGWRLDDCDKCRVGDEYHYAHATEEELAAHEAAIAWLRERAGVGR